MVGAWRGRVNGVGVCQSVSISVSQPYPVMQNDFTNAIYACISSEEIHLKSETGLHAAILAFAGTCFRFFTAFGMATLGICEIVDSRS